MPPDIQPGSEREALTLAYGRELFARIGHARPVPFSGSWWDERLMRWTMGDEAVKVQLFRFIDALPQLPSPQDVNRWPAIDLIDRSAAGPLPRVNVSVKLSSLYSQFDPIDPENTSRVVRERLRPILRAAQRVHAFVNVDMEQYAYKDLTIRIF